MTNSYDIFIAGDSRAVDIIVFDFARRGQQMPHQVEIYALTDGREKQTAVRITDVEVFDRDCPAQKLLRHFIRWRCEPHQLVRRLYGRAPDVQYVNGARV